jgi:hypothetical protein
MERCTGGILPRLPARGGTDPVRVAAGEVLGVRARVSRETRDEIGSNRFRQPCTRIKRQSQRRRPLLGAKDGPTAKIYRKPLAFFENLWE